MENAMHEELVILTNGSLVKRKEGAWRASFYYLDASGTRRRKFATIHADKRADAIVKREYERIRLQKEINDSIVSAENSRDFAAPPAKPKTFGECSKEYIAYRKASKSIEAATVKRNITDSNRLASISEKPVAEITPEDIEALIVELVNAGYSNTTVRGTVTYASQVFKHLVMRGMIDKNPCYGVKKPKAKKQKVEYLSEEDRNRLLTSLGASDLSPFSVGTYIAFYTGMRRGEICALKWSDVDFKRNQISVSRAIGTGDEEYVKPPKTDNLRTIPLCSNLKDVLLQWRANYPEEISDCFVLGHPFEDKNRWYSPSNLTKEWRFFCRMTRLGKYTFHSLRHTFAQALLVEARLDPVTVAAILGHADVSVTLNIYSAPDEKQKFAALPVINSIGA